MKKQIQILKAPCPHYLYHTSSTCTTCLVPQVPVLHLQYPCARTTPPVPVLHLQYSYDTSSTRTTSPVPVLHLQYRYYISSTGTTSPVPVLHLQYPYRTSSTRTTSPVPVLHFQYPYYISSTWVHRQYPYHTSNPNPAPTISTLPPIISLNPSSMLTRSISRGGEQLAESSRVRAKGKR